MIIPFSKKYKSYLSVFRWSNSTGFGIYWICYDKEKMNKEVILLNDYEVGQMMGGN